MALVRRCLLLLLAVLAPAALAAAASYQPRQQVPVSVNNVGPFHNPAESYTYYSLPYCQPPPSPSPPSSSLLRADDNLGEVLAGDRRRPSPYDLRFGVDVPWAALCQYTLSQDDIRKFTDAIRKHYVFELFVDELPVKGFVGEVEEESNTFEGHVHKETHVYLFTHLDFSVAYNNDRVISVNLTTDPTQRVELEYGKDITVEFSFSAHWVPTTVSYKDRLAFHARSSLGGEGENVEIHWLSIINSFVLVLLLTAFLAMVLMRALHKDFARYLDDDASLAAGAGGEEGGMGAAAAAAEEDEVGWKLVHGDVFRPPKHIMLFTCAVGNGAQILVLVISLLSLALLGTVYPQSRGALYSACVLFYAVTTCVAGYVATKLYLELGGTRWATSAVLTSCLFAGPFLATFSVANSVAWSYGSSSALPAQTIVLIVLLWALVSFPLTIFGSMRARHAHTKALASASITKSGGVFGAPCKTNRVEREIPQPVWYRSAPVHLLCAGFLPFSAIYIELHYIFASVWGHRVYTLYGILALAFLMLLMVTACVTISLTYFQLAAEDYNWWWRSFLSGASTGVFMYVYAALYYSYSSQMSGALQGTFFFGYMLVVSFAFSLMLGAVAFSMARLFVHHMYRSIKVD